MGSDCIPRIIIVDGISSPWTTVRQEKKKEKDIRCIELVEINGTQESTCNIMIEPSALFIIDGKKRGGRRLPLVQPTDD